MQIKRSQEGNQIESSRSQAQQKEVSASQLVALGSSTFPQKNQDSKEILFRDQKPPPRTASTRSRFLKILFLIVSAVNTVLLVRYIAYSQTPTIQRAQIGYNNNTQSAVQSVKYYPYMPLPTPTNFIVQCKEEYFTPSLPNQTYVTANLLSVFRVPYPGLVMVQHSQSPPISYHYPDLIAALNETPLKFSAYVHSAPPYVVLLLGAVSRNISITICYDYPWKDQLLTAFALNNIQQELLFQRQADRLVNRQRAEALITTSVEFAEKYLSWKRVMIVADGSVTVPKASGLLRFQHSGCTVVAPKALQEDATSKGIYFSRKRKEPYFYRRTKERQD